jgi:peptidoglycan biosynthesis protein MviN/MurJ (putative lipid II flippase)
VLMYRQLHGLELSRMLILVAKSMLAGAALAAVCAASVHWLLADWPTQAFWYKTVALFGTIIGAGLVFLGVGTALRIEELQELTAMVKRRLGRRRS